MNVGNNKMVMRPPKIKNKTPNPVQTTAEQLLKDAQAHQHKEVKPPQQRIKDEDELEDYKLRKRKEFEDGLRKQRYQMGTWIKYAQWEESLQEFRRARSVYERALDIDYKNISLWLKYAEMEMKHKFINHARNIWERACTYLPRVDQFWYKYSYMEEVLGNYNRAREIFERWMTWKPEEKAWLAYMKFEDRMSEHEKRREIMYRYLQAYPRLRTFLKVAQFEMKNKNKAEARALFEKGLEDLGEEAMKEEFFLAFAKFEIRNKEIDRARQIYNFGLENIPKDKAYKLYESYLSFEKQHGSKEEIDILIINKRRIQYKDILAKNPHNYDAWFDLIYLELSTKDLRRIRETFEAAVENKPPADEKRFWRRYIYLWYNYAVFEELDAGDLVKTKEVYDRALKVVPHEKFTFKKLWNMTAHFYVRCKNLDKARKIYGIAVGKCPREKLFESYIEMEMQLSNVDRCRTLFEKFIEVFPESPRAWIRYAEMEKQLDELDRYRSIFELAINQTSINEPESVWKSYIENEISLGDFDRTRDIYLKLLERTKHVKMWISYALFESTQDRRAETRKILKQADEYFKENPHLKEERVLLYEAWQEIEKKFGEPEMLEFINKKMPQKVKRRREIKIQEGDVQEEAGIEEYYDYIFPEDRTIQYSKILQKAHAWKKNIGSATPSTDQEEK